MGGVAKGTTQSRPTLLPYHPTTLLLPLPLLITSPCLSLLLHHISVKWISVKINAFSFIFWSKYGFLRLPTCLLDTHESGGDHARSVNGRRRLENGGNGGWCFGGWRDGSYINGGSGPGSFSVHVNIAGWRCIHYHLYSNQERHGRLWFIIDYEKREKHDEGEKQTGRNLDKVQWISETHEWI